MLTYNEVCFPSKIGIHERHKGTSPSPLKNLHEGTGHKNLSKEQFARSALKKKSQGIDPKIQTSLNSWQLFAFVGRQSSAE